jgi:hypothetical protein
MSSLMLNRETHEGITLYLVESANHPLGWFNAADLPRDYRMQEALKRYFSAA